MSGLIIHRQEYPDLRQLEVFCQIVDCRSMADAARLLGISQSAISQSLHKLEQQVGRVLIDRHCRPLQVTTAGECLHRESRTLLSEARRLFASAGTSDAGMAPFLRCGMIDSFASVFAPVIVKKLQPKVREITLHSGLYEPNETNLLRRQLDIVVTSSAMELIEGLERHHLFSDPYLLVVPKGTEVVGQDALRKLSRALDLIRYTRHSRMAMDIDIHLRRLEIKAPRRIEFENTDSMLALIHAGLGWGVTTALSLMQARYQSFELDIWPLPRQALFRELYLLAWDGERAELTAEVVALCRAYFATEVMPTFSKMTNGPA